MAQNIDRDCAQGFRAGRNFKRNNTWVFIDQHNESNLLLHGNRIAWTSDNRTKLNINQCGWDTPTTNNRLRALGVGVWHNRGKLWINGEPADDTTTYTMDL